jgi:hypothetical protein
VLASKGLKRIFQNADPPLRCESRVEVSLDGEQEWFLGLSWNPLQVTIKQPLCQ